MHRIGLVVLLAAAFAAPSSTAPQTIGARRPNVVLVVTDDAGYGDFGSYGAPDINTPHIDGLARDGVRLTDFYANGATCTPTRAGLMTGPLPAALRHRGAARRHGEERRGARPAADRPVAAAATEERRLRHRPDREVAPRMEARVQPERARLRLLLRLQERLHRLLPAHGRRDCAGRGRPVRERPTGRGRRLHDRPDHRPGRPRSSSRTRRGRSSSTSPTTPPHWPYQPPDQPSAARDNGAAPAAARRRGEHARRLRGDGRAGRSGCRPHSGRARSPRSAQQHARHLHQRQRRRVAVTQRAAVSPQGHGLGGRHPRAGHPALAGPHSAGPCPARWASRWT